MHTMKRQYLSLIHEYLSYFPCVVLIGARQTGKSTLIDMLDDERELFDLEQRADYDQIAHDPDLFLRLNNNPLAIDEAQLLPNLFPALRVAIDKDRTQYGKYLLTGSSSPQLLTAISESLAGRVGIIEIAPLTLSETINVKTPNLLTLFNGSCSPDKIIKMATSESEPEEIDDYWLNGGYPEPWLRNTGRFREIWREEYIKTYIERDVARLFPHMNSVRYRRFIELLAGCSGAIINYSNIAKILNVSQPTIKDYFDIAHGTFIWRNIPAYSKNVSKRVIKHPRGYLRDSGLLHHLLQIPSMRRLQSHPQLGSSWEGMVIEEILRTLSAAGIQHKPYYYRTSGGAEVDLVLEGSFGLIPFEIKHSQNVNIGRLRAIKDFVSEFNCSFGVIINRDERIRMYESNIIGIPLSHLISSASNC
ncbi:MAG: ATP-binding protein [Gammaproteobacteria bacterium]|nr:ATP-binding protein [Gammaproteobacteria bacterium]